MVSMIQHEKISICEPVTQDQIGICKVRKDAQNELIAQSSESIDIGEMNTFDREIFVGRVVASLQHHVPRS